MPLHLRAVALVLVGIVSVQFGAVFAKQAFEHATPLTVVCLRQLVGAIILMAWARPRLRGRSRRAWISVLGYAAALGVMNWAFYESFARIPLGIAVTIEFLGPLGLALVVSRRRIDFLWVALAATGIGVLGLERSSLDPVGVAFALLAGGLWALYIIGSTQTGREWEGLEGLAIASLLCAIVSAPLMFLVDGNPPSDVWLVGGMVGLLSSVIPYSAELVALRTMSQHTFSVMLSLEPGAAAFAAFLVIDERLTASQWGAIGLVVLASAGVNLTRPERVDAPLGLDAA